MSTNTSLENTGNRGKTQNRSVTDIKQGDDDLEQLFGGARKFDQLLMKYFDFFVNTSSNQSINLDNGVYLECFHNERF